MRNRVVLTNNGATSLHTTDVGGNPVLDVNVVQTVGGGGSGGTVDQGSAGVDPWLVAAQQSGVWSTRITDGTDTADVFDLSNSNPLAVAIVDSSGDQISSFGGGVQYTEGDTDASITGTAMLWEDSGNTLRVPSSAHPLPINTELADSILADDSTAAPTTAPVYSFLMGLKSGTSQWARARMAPDNADGLSTDSTGHIQVLAHTLAFNGSTWDRIRGDTTNGIDVDVTRVGGTVAVTQSGTWNITNISGTISLPTGAATEATLSTLNGKIPSNLTVTSTRLLVDGSGVTQPVSQSGTWTVQPGNTANTTAWLVTGTGGTFPATQSGTWNIGTVSTVTAVTTVSTVTSLTQMNGQAIAMGTGTRSAGTQRVTIATDDVVPASQSGTWNIGTVTTVSSVTAVGTITPGTAATSLGKAEDAAHSSGDVGVMALAVRADTAAATGADGDYTPLLTDSFGRLQVANISANKIATATLSNVSASATSVTILSANTARRQVVLVNDSSAIAYVKFGTTASTTSYTVQMPAIANNQASHLIIEEPSLYTGRIDAIWASATGNMRVTEITA